MLRETNIIFEKNIVILDQSDQAIYYYRIQNYDKALRLTGNVLSLIESLINELLNQQEYFKTCVLDVTNLDNVLCILNPILEAQEKQDYVLLADLLEGQLVPFIEQVQMFIVGNERITIDTEKYNKQVNLMVQQNPKLEGDIPTVDEVLEQGYQIEYTLSGAYTLSVNQGPLSFYMHSNNHTLKEAKDLAESWYTEEKITYIIYGLGLGYHVHKLAEIDDDIQIEVYESSADIFAMNCAFGNVDVFCKNPNINITYDPDCNKLFKRIGDIDDETEVVVHAPSLKLIREVSSREKLENYFLHYSSQKNQSKLLNGNFRNNIKNYDFVVDELQEVFQGKDLYIVAAGPSLDQNFMKLKSRGNNSIILATGTVFRKLVNAGIQPDYVIVTDANQRVIAQTVGLEDNEAKMILLATAYKGFANTYKNVKYIAFQKDFSLSEKYAREHGFNLYKTGGSVSTTALDIGISLGCNRIIFLGLDLAYPNNFVHASDTSRRELTNTTNLRQVRDINGNMVYTSKSLDYYRQWIEKRIANEQDIEIIDATEGGAIIKGMKIMKLEDII